MRAELCGAGTYLSVTHMAARGVVVFVLTLVLIRRSGRRSVGQHQPLGCVHHGAAGSILARGVGGASPFWPTITTGTALVLRHRNARRSPFSH